MKLPKDVNLNPELDFYYPVIDKTNHILAGRWVGTVEVVIDGYQDEDGWEYVSCVYLAYQLVSGRIVYVEESDPGVPTGVYSLKGTLYNIRWGYYPVGFRKEWQYCVAAPVAADGIHDIEPDELPF